MSLVWLAWRPIKRGFPLANWVSTHRGRRLTAGRDPQVDGSCRREPDSKFRVMLRARMCHQAARPDVLGCPKLPACVGVKVQAAAKARQECHTTAEKVTLARRIAKFVIVSPLVWLWWGHAMPVKINKLLLLARDLRARAEEVLAQAETFKDADAQRKLRKIAADYEKLAQRLEKASSGTDEA